jgi:maltooligosyltrehalose trehalohydrolase
MTEFRVWAPLRDKVELLLGEAPHALKRTTGGWWRTDIDGVAFGQDYQYRLDAQEVWPDPRSLYQPNGVRGASRLIDVRSFSWTDDGFQARPLSSALIYEIHVGTFTPEGTFEAVIERLDHLVRLGVTHLELMPVVEFAGERGWGYDGVFPFAPHRVYGGPIGLAKLVDACHSRNIAVILDVVYNHLGPSGNCLGEYGPYFTDRHKTPWGSSLNFDGPYSDDVRQYFVDNAVMWLRDYHIDGLRLDAVHAIVDTSAFPFLEQLAAEVRHLEAQVGKHLTLIAESDLNDPRIIRPQLNHGFGFHAQWNDDFHHAIHAALTQENAGYYSDYGGLDDLACVFERPYLYTGRFSPHRLRSHGRPSEGVHASSFIGYSQNHDQVGNRATGERLHQLLPFDLAKVAAALTILSPYVPMLFQGEEWAASSPFQYFVDFSEDPNLASAVVEGRRQEFAGLQSASTVPDPQDVDTFERSKLNWREADADDHRAMLQWYEQLIQARRRLPALVDGRLERVKTRYDQQRQWLIIEREKTYFLVNIGADPVEIALGDVRRLTLELASSDPVEVQRHVVRMPGHSVALLTSSADL